MRRARRPNLSALHRSFAGGPARLPAARSRNRERPLSRGRAATCPRRADGAIRPLARASPRFRSESRLADARLISRKPRKTMRLSRYFLPMLKETPKEAEIASHRLMLRAGMIRQEGAGIYAWLPLGLRVLHKICADRARGAEPRRRDRAVDADAAIGRSVARIRPLRRLRQGDAAHPRPPRARHALRSDQRGDDHRDLPRQRALVQGSAAQPLPHPVEVPRRGAAALRRHALARVPDEGRLFLRPRRRRARACPTTRCSPPICAPSRASA